MTSLVGDLVDLVGFTWTWYALSGEVDLAVSLSLS